MKYLSERHLTKAVNGVSIKDLDAEISKGADKVMKSVESGDQSALVVVLVTEIYLLEKTLKEITEELLKLEEAEDDIVRLRNDLHIKCKSIKTSLTK